MGRIGLMQYQAQGDVVLERLKGQPVPALLKAPVKDFEKAHAAYSKASARVDDARGARDTALLRVSEADAELDEALEVLAQRMVGAGLGNRRNPLQNFTRHTVTGLRALAYKREADEVVAMGAKIAASQVPKDVTASAARCVKLAKLVQARLAALVQPQAAYDKTLRERDGLLLDWMRAYSRLKKMAAAAWADDEPTYASVFAPAAEIHAPKARRASHKKANEPAPTP